MTQHFALALIAGAMLAATNIDGSIWLESLSLAIASWSSYFLFMYGFSMDPVKASVYRERTLSCIQALPWALSFQILEKLLCQ